MPCLSGLLLALVPGLEDENGDQYTRVFKMMNQVIRFTDTRTGFSCLWKALSKNPSLRKAILNFFMSEIPQPSSLEKKLIEDFLPDHNNLVMSGLLAAIGDKQLLVQRSALDLTIKLFPLHSKFVVFESVRRGMEVFDLWIRIRC
eukprot:TRINITY_DN6772_c0_g1_i12.p1 TRINITY_DN6772_c0_g1~~TRINITY_DN6772_c0_g1_i12.p1  ORF type:complete len:145 (-),score=23.77 TRINITY_DN6772_c0_g1_i12:678-1112(-)